MFADIEADIYVLADGDDTYDAAASPGLVETLCREQLDMVNAARNNTSREAYRCGHRYGNRMFTRLVSTLLANPFDDILYDSRVFLRRCFRVFASSAYGFEIANHINNHT